MLDVVVVIVGDRGMRGLTVLRYPSVIGEQVSLLLLLFSSVSSVSLSSPMLVFVDIVTGS